MILRLLKQTPVAGNVWSFEFAPNQRLSWIAGQFIQVNLPHPTPDAEGTRRRFTIASAPHEHIIRLSTRITTSSFKQALASLPIGGELMLVDPPAGDFIWQEASRPHILVANGIGITPYYSILRDRLYHRQPLTATLVYANRPNTAIPFQTELNRWARQDPNFHVLYEAAPITTARLAQLVPDLATRYIYVSGPEAFLELISPPYDLPVRQLKHDFFPGYHISQY